MPHDRNQDLTELHRWIAGITPELGLTPDEVPVGDVLDLSRVIASEVVRPGVPVTSFLVGLAVGRGLPVEEALALVTRAAHDFRSADHPSS